MEKAKEDLKAILDLLAEWRQENGVGYVNMYIVKDGCGHAYTFDQTDRDVETELQRYTPWTETAETPAAGTAGESEK